MYQRSVLVAESVLVETNPSDQRARLRPNARAGLDLLTGAGFAVVLLPDADLHLLLGHDSTLRVVRELRLSDQQRRMIAVAPCDSDQSPCIEPGSGLAGAPADGGSWMLSTSVREAGRAGAIVLRRIDALGSDTSRAYFVVGNLSEAARAMLAADRPGQPTPLTPIVLAARLSRLRVTG